MAEMKVTVEIKDWPEFKAGISRLKKVMRRRAWINGAWGIVIGQNVYRRGVKKCQDTGKAAP